MVYFSTRNGKETDHMVYAYADDAFTTLTSEPRDLFTYPKPGIGTIDGSAVTPPAPDLTDENTNRDERSNELYLRDRVALGAGTTVNALGNGAAAQVDDPHAIQSLSQLLERMVKESGSVPAVQPVVQDLQTSMIRLALQEPQLVENLQHPS